MRRQFALGVGVVHFVRHMSEKGAARLETIDPHEGLIDAGMAWVRRFAQRVDDDDVEVSKQGQARFWDRVHVGEVGGVAEAEAGDFLLAVKQGNALEGDSVNDDGLVSFDAVHLHASACGVFGFGGEGVVEDFFDDARAGVIGVEGHVAVGVVEGERAQIVEAEDVIGVRMRIEDRIDVADVFAQGLLAEIGSGVDEDAVVCPLHGGGGARAPVAGIRRGANAAFASERRNAHGSAAAKDGERGLHSVVYRQLRVLKDKC